MNEWFSFARLSALLIKEFIQIRRDRFTFAMMLGMPLVQLMIFGYAINSDPKALPTVLLAGNPDHYTRAVVTALESTGYYRFVSGFETQAAAEAAMARGEVEFIVTIPEDFGRRVARGDTPVLLVEADASDPAAGANALAALPAVAAGAVARELPAPAGLSQIKASDVTITVHSRYNEEGITQYNVVPGIVGVILQMTMVMMTSIGLTRETERGTMENLLAMPASPLEIMLGKVLPYFVVGAVQLVVILAAGRLLFHVPFVGSLAVLLVGVLAFVLSLLLMGYVFSTIARSQMQAMQLTIFYFLPSILLSGFVFPFRGMPAWAQIVGECIPLTHFLRIIRGIMLRGAGLADVVPEFAALVVFVVVLGAIALLRFRRTLD